jgi:hypothetical protein
MDAREKAAKRISGNPEMIAKVPQCGSFEE